MAVECMQGVYSQLQATCEQFRDGLMQAQQENSLLQQQVNTLAAHCHELAVQKDSDTLERQTRAYLDEAHEKLLTMASKGKVTNVEVAADSLVQAEALQLELILSQKQIESESHKILQCEARANALEDELIQLQASVRLHYEERGVWTNTRHGIFQILASSLSLGHTMLQHGGSNNLSNNLSAASMISSGYSISAPTQPPAPTATPQELHSVETVRTQLEQARTDRLTLLL